MASFEALGGDAAADFVRLSLSLSCLPATFALSRAFCCAIDRAILSMTQAKSEKSGHDLANGRRNGPALLLGICGPPGAGKTTLAAVLAQLLRCSGANGGAIGADFRHDGDHGRDEAVAVVEMDAYHLTNETLAARGMLQRKGLPETVDASGLVAHLSGICAGQETWVPKYDRQKHCAVEMAARVDENTNVVIVEGVHLCNTDDAQWGIVRDMMDMMVLLEPMDEEICRERVVARKVANGLAREEAEAHFERVDRVNIEQIKNDFEKMKRTFDKPILIIQFGRDPVDICVEYRTPFTRTASKEFIPSDLYFSGSGRRIAVMGPNPALQKTMTFGNGWARDSVNRADHLNISVGGKGQQFARALNRIISCEVDSESRKNYGSLFQFLGGANGSAVESLLKESGIPEDEQGSSAAIIQKTTRTAQAETRTCLTLIDSRDQTATEIIEPSAMIFSDQVFTMIASFQNEISNCLAAVALCGTMPPGAEDLYDKVSHIASEHSLIVWLDGFKGVEKTLSHVSILKINLAELRALAGIEDKVNAASSLFIRLVRLFAICVTDQGNTAYIFHRDGTRFEFFQEQSVSQAEFKNPIGAGDTVGAVTLHRYLMGDSLVEAFSKGLAAGTASCLELDGANFSESNVERFYSTLKVVKIK